MIYQQSWRCLVGLCFVLGLVVPTAAFRPFGTLQNALQAVTAKEDFDGALIYTSRDLSVIHDWSTFLYLTVCRIP